MLRKWNEDRLQRKEMKEYIKRHGEDSWKNREVADYIIQRFKKEREEDFLGNETRKGYGSWEWGVRGMVRGEHLPTIVLFPVFKTIYEKLWHHYPSIQKYKWLNGYWFHKNDLEKMIQFFKCMRQLLIQTQEYNQIDDESTWQNLNTDSVLKIKKRLLLLRERTFNKMQNILNPVTQKFNDTTSTEEAFVQQVSQKLNRLELETNALNLPNSSTDLSIESLRELNSILSDEWVSSATKERARKTLNQIEENRIVEESKRKRENAEMDALSVISASMMVHHVDSSNVDCS